MAQLILLQYPSVTGEVMLKNYVGYILCGSFEMKTSSSDNSVGMMAYGTNTAPRPSASGGNVLALTQSNPSDTPPVSGTPGGDASSQRLGIDSVTVRRNADSATPSFLTAAFAARADGTNCTFTILRAADSGSNSSDTPWNVPFLTIAMNDVHISSHELSIGADSLEETITIGFKSMTLTYTLYTNGVKKGNFTSTLSLAADSASSGS